GGPQYIQICAVPALVAANTASASKFFGNLSAPRGIRFKISVDCPSGLCASNANPRLWPWKPRSPACSLRVMNTTRCPTCNLSNFRRSLWASRSTACAWLLSNPGDEVVVLANGVGLSDLLEAPLPCL